MAQGGRAVLEYEGNIKALSLLFHPLDVRGSRVAGSGQFFRRGWCTNSTRFALDTIEASFGEAAGLMRVTAKKPRLSTTKLLWRAGGFSASNWDISCWSSASSSATLTIESPDFKRQFSSDLGSKSYGGKGFSEAGPGGGNRAGGI